MNAKVLFDLPQREIASLLRNRLECCTSASLVAGFMTPDGIEAVAEPLRAQPGKLSSLVVGAGNYRAFQACDRLLEAGVNPGAVHVHLGSTRPSPRKLGFVRYHPMLHSKVYLMEHGDGTATAFVGSHNLTGFALRGLNGEASVLLEGPSSSAEFDDIRSHIAEAVRQAVVYDPSKREAYAWWAEQYIRGLGGTFNDVPRDASGRRTMVVMAECAGPDFPGPGDVVYFEIPEAIDPITSLQTEVHLFVFDTLPSTPAQGLNELARAKLSLSCQTVGVEDDGGGMQLQADWQIQNPARPVLSKVPDPFQTSPQPGMQQVRVRVRDEAVGSFAYLFDADHVTWRPLFDSDEQVPGLGNDAGSPNSRYAHSGEAWYRVNDLVRVTGGEGVAQDERVALTDMSPESGNYILMSLRRRRRNDESGND